MSKNMSEKKMKKGEHTERLVESSSVELIKNGIECQEQEQQQQHHGCAVETEESVIKLENASPELNALLQVYKQTQLNGSILKVTFFEYVALLYAAASVVLFIVNCEPHEYIHENLFMPFHMTEFWSAFVFAMTEAFLLSTTTALYRQQKPLGVRNVWLDGLRVLHAVVALDIAVTFVAAMLMTLDGERYERVSHYAEYIALLPLTLLDLIFIVRNRSSGNAVRGSQWQLRCGVALLVFVAAVVQLFIYSELIPTHEPSRTTHFIEFSINFVNACFAVWFAVQTRNEIHKKCVIFHVA